MNKILKKMFLLCIMIGSLSLTVLGAEEATAIIQNLTQSSNMKVPDISGQANKGRIFVVVDGKDVTSAIPSDQKPIITKQGVTYLSVKMVQTLIPGTSVEYTESNKLVTIRRGDKWLYMMLGKSIAYVGTEENMEQKTFAANNCPAVVKGRTYLPLRFLSDGLGCQVVFDQNKRVLSIATTGGTPIIPEEIGGIEISPTQTVELACNVLIKNEIGNLGNELGLTEAESAEIKKSCMIVREQMVQELADGLTSSISTKLTDDQAQRYANAIMGAFQRVKISVSLISQTETTAEVRVVINYIDLNEVLNRAFSEIEARAASVRTEDEKTELVIQCLVQAFNEAQPSKGANMGVVDLVYDQEQGLWTFANTEEAFTMIGSKLFKVSK